jgi:hypothetical protein
MWPFRGTTRHASRPADPATYAELFELWSRAEHREVLSSYQLGFVRARHTSRRRPPLPFLQLLVAPGESIDFAHPRSGFTGLDGTPPRERVLTLWADDLVSVRHGDDWIYVIDADQSLNQAWLALLAPPGGHAPPPYAIVTAAFGGPAASGQFRVADVAATAPATLVRIEDRRADVTGQAVRGPTVTRARP